MPTFPDSHYRHVGSNKLRAHKHHGSRKETDSTKLAEFDIVLTTYATVAAECPSQGRLHGMAWFRIILDEDKLDSMPSFI